MTALAAMQVSPGKTRVPSLSPAAAPEVSTTIESAAQSIRTPCFRATAGMRSPPTRNRPWPRFHAPTGFSTQIGPSLHLANCGRALGALPQLL